MNISTSSTVGTGQPVEVPFELSEDQKCELRVAELAKLTQLQYERCRSAEAKALNIRAAILDKLVQAERNKEPEVGNTSFSDVTPWPEQVRGDELLSELRSTILRFSVLPEHSAPLMAAWALHAWAHDASDISPVLAFVSPEKRCGKTTALSVMGALTPKSMHAVNISTSVLFRVIERHAPTILIDEGDTFLAANDELRGVLNGGHNRLSAFVWRTAGDDHEPRQFRVWSPKCIAMIGKLPDTLEDRALVVPLRRKRDGETVERFRADRMDEFLLLRRKAARWAADKFHSLRNADPDVPEALNDRAQDNARLSAQSRMLPVANGRRLFALLFSVLPSKWPTSLSQTAFCCCVISQTSLKRIRQAILEVLHSATRFPRWRKARGANGGWESRSLHVGSPIC